MTSRMEPNPNNVLYEPNIWKNLLLGSLLSKNGFKLVFYSNKFMLTKNGMLVDKGSPCDGLFMMNVMSIVPS